MKFTTKIALFFFLLTLVSCFEIIEEVSLKNDGSGNINFSVNLSKSKTKLNAIKLLDSVNGYKVPSEKKIKKHLLDLKTKINKIVGVSKVKTTYNFEDYIFTVSCDFTNIDVLNELISNFSSKNEAKIIQKNKHFTFNKKTKIFTRNYHYNLQKEFKKVNAKDRAIFQDATITTIYRFESSVKKIKNLRAKISKSKKAVFLRVNAQDIITNKNNIKNTITLTR